VPETGDRIALKNKGIFNAPPCIKRVKSNYEVFFYFSGRLSGGARLKKIRTDFINMLGGGNRKDDFKFFVIFLFIINPSSSGRQGWLGWRILHSVCQVDMREFLMQGFYIFIRLR